MSNFLTVLSGVLLFVGAAAVFIGGVGILRMPDIFTRLHVVGITDTVGVASILLGLTLIAGWSLVLIKLIIILALLMLLNTTASHALARAAVHGAKKPWLANSK